MCDLVFFFVMLVFFFVMPVFFSVMLVIGCALRVPKHKYQTEKHKKHKHHNNSNNSPIVIGTQSQASQPEMHTTEALQVDDTSRQDSFVASRESSFMLRAQQVRGSG